MADRSALEEWATWAFSPSISAVLFTLLVALTLPLALHYYLYRQSAGARQPPTFLLVGASGSGKTSLLTLFSNGALLHTHTSSTPSSALCTLPASTRAASDRYRSEHDDSRVPPSFRLLDTPGHGKLRHHALSALSAPTTALKGLIFVVDSAAASLTESAEYLHDVLLVLQKRHTQGKSSKDPESVAVLVAANKQDVFSALPPGLVKAKLEEEIARVRRTRSKGLLDSSGEEGEEEAGWLGEFGSERFAFEQMAESGVEVVVKGGNVRGEREGEGGKVGEWWEWVAENL